MKGKTNLFHRHCLFRLATACCLTLTAVLPLYPVAELSANAAETDEYGRILSNGSGTYQELSWQVKNHVLTITGKGEMADIVDLSSGGTFSSKNASYPWSDYYFETVHIGEGITTVGAFAFTNWSPSYKSAITTVTLPSTLEEIHDMAFWGCDSLTDIELNPQLTVIDDAAFQGSGIQQLTIPAGVTELNRIVDDCEQLTSFTALGSIETIPEQFFSGCSQLTYADFGNSVRYIGEEAFRNTSLKEFVLGENVEEIGEAAFQDCPQLYHVDMQCQLTEIPAHLFEITDESADSINYPLEIVLPESVLSIGDYAFANRYMINTDGGIFALPAALERVGRCSFSGGCSELALPDSVTSIYVNSFCHVDTLTLGAGLTKIQSVGGSLTIQDSHINRIFVSENNPVFSSTDGTALYSSDKTVLYGVFSVPDGTFTLPQTVTSLGNPIHAQTVQNFAVEAGSTAFSVVNGILMSADGKTLVQYPNGRTDTVVQVPEGITTIGKGAFYCSAAEQILLPESVRTIEEKAFAYSALTDITFSSKTETIGDYAFLQTKIIEVRIPASVMTIGTQAFVGDSYVTLIFEHPAGTTVLSYASYISDCSSFCGYVGGPIETLYPQKFKPLEDVSSGTCGSGLHWSTVGGKLTITGSGTMQYQGSVPWSGTTITSISFSGSNITIPNNVFASQKNLITVDLTGVTSIGSRAFYNCTNLYRITGDKSVKTVGDRAFENTKWLGSPVYYDTANRGLACIGAVILQVNGQAETITIPDEVSYVGEKVFYNAVSLKTLYLPQKAIVFDADAFGSTTMQTLEHVRWTGNVVDITFTEFQSQAKNIKQIQIYDESGSQVTGYGYSKDNTLLYLANSLYNSAYIQNLLTNAYDRIFQLNDITDGKSDSYLIKKIYEGVTSRTTYGYLYGEDPNGSVNGTNGKKWTLNRNSNNSSIGPTLLGYGICMGYTDCIEKLIDRTREKGYTKTLLSDRKGGDNHVFNIIGLNTGTRNEAWYYLDATNNLYLAGYENSQIKAYAAMYGYSSSLKKNQNGTYTIRGNSGKQIQLQGCNQSASLPVGDLDKDGKISMTDAYDALILSSKISVGISTSELSSAKLYASDVNRDGRVSMMDAYYILIYSSYVSLGEKKSWDAVINQ